MISQAQIVRMVRAHQYHRLVERILDNGRLCSVGVRRRLLSPAIAPVAGLALAVQRYLELNYFGRSQEGDRLIRLLVGMQDPTTGLFGGVNATDDDRLIATTMAIRALLDFLGSDAQFETAPAPALGKKCGLMEEDARQSVAFSAASALQRAADALITCRALEHMHGGTAETAGIIAWQLGDAPYPVSQTPDSLLESLSDFAAKMYNNRHPLAEAAREEKMSKSASRKQKSSSISARKTTRRNGAASMTTDNPVGLSRHVQRVIRASRHGGLIQRRGY